MTRQIGFERKIRIAYLLTHPIQYQSPFLQRIAREPEFNLKVFYCSNYSVKEFTSDDFTTNIKWDIPLLDGYQYDFLPSVGTTNKVSFWRPWNFGLVARLRKGNFDVLWVHGYARWMHLFSILAAYALGIRVLVRGETTPMTVPRNMLSKKLRKLFFKILKRLCHAFLAIGTLNRRYYQEQGISDTQICMVPYAVDNASFQNRCKASSLKRNEFRSSIGLTPGRPTILFAGRLISRKRPDDLLEAYIRLSPDGKKEPVPYLLFVGDGYLRSKLEKRSSETGWKSILFLGFKNQSEMPAFYDLSDVFVLPSLDETWGLVVNEIMNAGRPVIVGDRVGCSADLVRNGQNGFIFKSGDISSLHGVLKNFLGMPAQWESMGKESLHIINSWSFEEDVAGIKKALYL